MVLLTIFALLCTSPGLLQASSPPGQPQQELIIGLYAPLGTSWRQTVEAAWGETQRTRPTDLSPLHVTFVHLKQAFNVSLQNTRDILDHLVKSSVSVVLGPYSPILELVTNDAHIPYLSLTAPSRDTTDLGFVRQGFTYHMLPSPNVVSDATVDLILKYGWRKAAVIYDMVEGLQLVERLMEIRYFDVRAWKVHASDSEELRNNLIHIRQVRMRNVLVVCKPDNLDIVMQEGLRLSMLSPTYSWVVVDLDPREIDYEPYLYSQVNYTTFQLYDLAGVDHVNKSGLPGQHLDMAVSLDALQLVTDAYDSHRTTANKVRGRRDTSTSINNYFKHASYDGVTGHVTFDANHGRSAVQLRVISLGKDGLVDRGTWQNGSTMEDRLYVKEWNVTELTVKPQTLRNRLVRIVIVLDPPFIMESKLYKTGLGNERWEGFLVDLIEQIAQRVGFMYELYEAPDGQYGTKVNGEWNGMILELITGNASMSLGAMSISTEREHAVDFAKPYKHRLLSILLKKPQEKTSIFQFLWPLSTHVWLLTVTSIVVVGFLLRLMDYFSPNSDHPTEGRFGTSESMWFVYGSLVGAGTEILPRTISGRLLTGAWWFFGLILVSSYTANLAAFLTVTKIDTPIKSIEDLTLQTAINYGTVKGSYFTSLLEHSDVELFKKMWTHMSKLHNDSIVHNTSEGVRRVKEGNYAFIWDLPINKYITMHHCDTMATREVFDEKGYGIGVPLGASYRDDITMAILALNENGGILALEKKWWTEGKCGEFQTTQTSETQELNLTNVAGVFVVVALGALAALIACMIEFIWGKSRPKSRSKKITDNVADGSATENKGLTQMLFFNNKADANSPPESHI